MELCYAACRLAWAGDARVRPRTQASLAVSADGENWLLINASPDLPQQVSAIEGAASAQRNAALEFKCDVLWAMLDALYHAYVAPKHIPPGAFVPEDWRRSTGARPRLPRGVRLVHNEAQGGWVLLAPERVFKADPIAAEIIKRCTGEVTFGEIVDDLAKTYAAPREKILADVGALLRGLADKKLLEL
jgi:pyrroloquinoline quinone biosynthesis protein D